MIRRSANPPAVRIATPVEGATVTPQADQLPVAWTATDPDADRLVYTVLYSGDGGENWRIVAQDQRDTTVAVPIRNRPQRARIRVLASDGGRSSQAEVGFSFTRP